MPKYKYTARDIKAERRSGEIEARDEADALSRLAELNLFTLRLSEKTERKSRYVMKSRQLAEFSRELSLMLKSGLPMVKALSILCDGEIANQKRKEVYQNLHRALRGGASLSESMREQGRTFPDMMINMVYSGEISGTIGEVMEKMAEYYESDYKLRKKISQATTYPKILMALTGVALVIIFGFVLPSILELVGEQELPAVTRLMKGISDIIIYRWYNVLIMAAICIVVFVYMRTIRSVLYYAHLLLVRLYLIGPLFRTVYTARFARSLSSLYGSGIQLVIALGVASGNIGNLYIQAQFSEAIRRVKQGESLSQVIGDMNGFNNKLKSLVVIGEETGKLDDILSSAAKSLEYDSEVAINSLLSVLEPALLIIMAAVIGTTIIAVLLPLFSMYQTIGGM